MQRAVPAISCPFGFVIIDYLTSNKDRALDNFMIKYRNISHEKASLTSLPQTHHTRTHLTRVRSKSKSCNHWTCRSSNRDAFGVRTWDQISRGVHSKPMTISYPHHDHQQFLVVLREHPLMDGCTPLLTSSVVLRRDWELLLVAVDVEVLAEGGRLR